MIRMVLMGVLLMSACFASSGESGQKTLTIVAKGEGRYRIVTPDSAKPPIPYAARELQQFVETMSGVLLPIVTESQAGDAPALIVGRARHAIPQTDLDRLNEDGVLIRTVGDDIMLLGKGPRGQLYSVYELLERFLGVRFLTQDCTIVHKRDTIKLPVIDWAYSPPFMYRETLYFDSFPKEIAVRHHLNGPNTQCDEEVGGKIAFFPYVHSFCQLLPPDQYYAQHPEYFSLVNGKRTNAAIHGQLCLTNPEVLRIGTERVLQWIEEHPDVPIIDVSQNDGEAACECDACRAVVAEEGSQHGPILRFVNAIADVVAKKYPGKWIETLAYAYSTKPPAHEKPRPNVIIRLCHAGCFFHGFETCGLGANLTQYLDGWGKLTRRIFVWHYITNFAHYLAPNQNLDGLVKDIRYYAAHGVNGLMVQGNYQGHGGELAELRQYLSAQLMWDPSRDPAALRREFCLGYYGAAADAVLDYLALMDRAATDPNVHAFAAWDPQGTVTPAFVKQGAEILVHAQTVADTPETRNRVDKLLLSLWYMQLAFPDKYGLDKAARPELLTRVNRLVEANDIQFVREGGVPNVPEWLKEMESN